jgi:hypothetical protein
MKVGGDGKKIGPGEIRIDDVPLKTPEIFPIHIRKTIEDGEGSLRIVLLNFFD